MTNDRDHALGEAIARHYARQQVGLPPMPPPDYDATRKWAAYIQQRGQPRLLPRVPTAAAPPAEGPVPVQLTLPGLPPTE